MLTYANPFNVTDAGALELDGARGVATAVVNGTTYLFVAGRNDDGISVFSVASDGTLTNVAAGGNVTDAGALELDGAFNLTTAMIGGTTYLFATGFNDDGISVFSVANNGALTNVAVAGGNVTDAGALELDGAAGVTTALSGGNRYLIATGFDDNGVSVFSVAATGALTSVFNVDDASNGALELLNAIDVTTAIVGGVTYVFVAGNADNGVSTFRLNTDGSLTNIAGGNVTDGGALELAGAAGVTTAVVGGTTYLFVAGNVDDGVSVFSVAPNGTLTGVFNVTDNAALELDGASDVTTAVYGGVTYLYVTGAEDNGVSVFSVAANGALTNVANIPDAGNLHLGTAGGLATATINNTAYVFASGESDDGVSVLNQDAPSGQLWYLVGGAPADTSAGHVNNDGSNAILEPMGAPVEGQAEIGIDLPAGYYFTASTDHLFIESRRISDGSLVSEVQIGDANGAGTLDDDLVRGLLVDPFNEFVYVSRWGETLAETGIVRVSYNPVTGVLDATQAYNAAQTRIVDSSDPGGITHPRDMQLITDYVAGGGNDFIYYVDNDAGYDVAPFDPRHGVYRIDLNNLSAGATLLSNQAQFPTDMSAGFIQSLAVNVADGLIYFMTHEPTDNAAHLWRMSITGGVATEIAAPAGHPLAIGDIPTDGLTFDPVTEQLYITVQGNIPQGHLVDEVIQVQMSANGQTIASVVDFYNIDELVGHDADPNAHVAGTVYDQLPTFTKTDVGTAAVEQGSAVDIISSPSITDLDNDHLASATVQISGSFAGSGDLLFVLDGVTEKTSGTFTGIPGITIAVTTDGSGNKTLTLTGYDTLANYQTVLNAVGFRSTGDNPTNYGYNDTRTINWTVSDGAQDVPFGGQNTAITTLSITAANDAPTNNPLPATPSINEDVQTPITGIVITDVDADPANQDITVTFSVTHGTLNVLTNVLNGILASDITAGGQDTNSITITAPQNAINATIAANGLRYTSDLNFNSGFAAEALHIVTSDNGHTGTPSALDDTDDLSLNIVAVNDAPNLQPDTTSAVGYIENATPTALFSLENVDTPLGDVDQSANYSGGSVDLNITAGLVTGDRISLTGARFVIVGGAIQDTANGNAVVGTIGATNATSHVTVSALTAAATPSVVDALIKSFGYDSTSDNPGAGDRTITLTFNDGGNTGGGALTDAVTQTVNVTPVNDNPVSTITPPTYAATEQVNLVLKNNGLAVSDVDGNAGVETITLSVTEGILTVTVGDSGVTVDSGNGTSSVVVSGTLTQLNALLGAGGTSNLVYNANSNTPSASTTLTLLIDDNGNSPSGDLTGTDSATINITAVNDVPVAVLGTDPYAATENVALNIKNTGMSVSDVDAGSAVVTATLSVAEGVLNVTAGGSGAIVANSGTNSVTVTGTLAQINALLNTDGTSTVSYTETNDNPAAAVTLTLQIDDGGATGTPGAQTGTDTSTINITAVNDAPVSTITPTTYSATEQTVLSLKNNGLAVSDVDGNAGNETITLSVTEGTLTVAAGTSGVTIDSGNGTSSVVVSGTVAQLNDFLNTNATSTISYLDNTDTPSASATLTLLIDDNGFTGGGDLTGTDSATINITAVNDTPDAVMTTDPYTATEQTGLSLKNTGMSVSDVDAGGAAVTVTLSVTLGVLNVAAGTSGAIVNNSGTAAVTITGTLAQINALLNTDGTSTVSYINNSDNPTAADTLSLNVDDGGATGGGALNDTDTSAINITAVNDAPAATITPTSYSGQPNNSINLKNNGLAISDIDGNAGSETVTLSVTSGTLTVTAGGSGAGVAGSGTSSVTITGTIAQINALLNTDGTSTVSYLDTGGGTQTLTLAINDNGNTGGGALTGQDTANILLDEPPTITGTGQTVGYSEQQTTPAAVVIDNDLVVGDPDAPADPADQINSATVTISAGGFTGDALNADVGSTGIVLSGAGTSALTLTGPATLAEFQEVLRSVTFTSSSDDPTNGGANTSRTVTWVVNDIFDVPSAPVTSTVNVTAVNDGPVSVVTPTSYSATEQVALNLKNNGLSVSDVDANVGSVTVTLSVTEGTLTVTAGGSGAGVAGSGTNTVTLTGTIAQINALLNTDGTSTVSYTDGTDNPSANATLTLAVDDGGATGGGALTAQDTATVNITAVNDAPAATITPPTYNATENVALSLKNNGLSVGDIDGNAGSETVTLSVTEGILNVTAGGSGVGVSGSGTGSVTITGTIAQINALLNTDATSTVDYVETDDTPSATATLTLAINDNGNTGGGDLTTQDTATVNITAVNDLPVVGNLTPSITYVIAAPPQTLSSGATVADPDSATLVSASVTLTDHQAGDELSVSGATTGGPVNGISWTYTGATGVLAFTGSSSLANYQALLDQVQYRSTSGDPSNGGANPSRDVAWVVNDGTDPSVTQHTSINVGNQAPTVDLNGGSGGTNVDVAFFEDGGAIGVASASLSITDPDDANLTSATIVLTNAKPDDSLSISGALPGGITSNITSGVGTITVTLSGNTSRANYQTAIQQVLFNNSSDNPDTTDRQITVTVNDGQDNSNSAITTVHFGIVNDGPTNTVPGTQNVEANTATAIGGLLVADPDSGGAAVTTTLSVGHGTLTVASAGGAAVSGSGTGTVTLIGSVAAINTTLLAANNIVYKGALDFFGTDTLTVTTNDGGNTGAGGPLADLDNVTINLNTLINGTSGDDSYNALPGQEMINGGGGIDTITFGFRLVDATVTYTGNRVIIDGPTGSHTVLTGFEVFNFADGTVNNNDGNALVDDLFYYSQYHDVWNAHLDADANYNDVGWHQNRDPNAFFSTVVYLSEYPDVQASGVNPLVHFDTAGWLEHRIPSITFDPNKYLAANPDVAAAHVDPLVHFLAFGAGEGRQPIPPTEIIAPSGFDYVYYLQNNPDVAAAHVDPLLHYNLFGWHEGRNPNALFDVNGYLTTYTDVAAANINPLDHYNIFGWHEGRDPSPNFDTTSYLAAYSDVAAANVNPLNHFLQFGIHEGRSPFADGLWG